MKKLDFEVVDCDGGEYSSDYSISNLLKESNDEVYCSTKQKNVNLILKIQTDEEELKEFYLKEYKIIAPQSGFTCPIGTGLLWVLNEEPKVDDFSKYDDFTESDFKSLEQKSEKEPISFFDMGSSWEETYTISPTKGKFLFFKFLTSRVSGHGNIDVQEVSLYGFLEKKQKALENHLEFLESEINNSRFSDLKIKVDGEEFQGHKLMFGQCKKLDIKNQAEFELKDVKLETFKEVLDLLYTGRCKISDSNLIQLLSASEKLGFDGLKDSCLDFIVKTQCNQENVCKLLMDAKKGKYGEVEIDILTKKCEKFISKNAEKVFESKDFMNLDPEILVSIIKSDQLCIDEISIFNSIIKYGNHHRKDVELAKYLEPFIPFIRFPFIYSDDLILIVKPTKTVPINLYLEAMEWQLSPESVKVEGIQYKERGGTPRFTFDIKSGNNPSFYQLSDKGYTVTKIGGGSGWGNAMVYGTIKMTKGKYYYEYKINHINNDKSGFAIGLAKSNNTQTQYSQDDVIGLSGYQYGLQGSNGCSVNANETVGVYVDFNKSKFWFFHNGKQLPVTGTLQKNTSYYPVVHLYYVTDSCTLIFPSKIPKPK